MVGNGRKDQSNSENGSRAKHKQQAWVIGVNNKYVASERDFCGRECVMTDEGGDTNNESRDGTGSNTENGGTRNGRIGGKTTIRHYVLLPLAVSIPRSPLTRGEFLTCANESGILDSSASGTAFVAFESLSDTSEACVMSRCS